MIEPDALSSALLSVRWASSDKAPPKAITVGGPAIWAELSVGPLEVVVVDDLPELFVLVDVFSSVVGAKIVTLTGPKSGVTEPDGELVALGLGSESANFCVNTSNMSFCCSCDIAGADSIFTPPARLQDTTCPT